MYRINQLNEKETYLCFEWNISQVDLEHFVNDMWIVPIDNAVRQNGAHTPHTHTHTDARHQFSILTDDRDRNAPDETAAHTSVCFSVPGQPP